jgi:heme/copper-type cytochrome/quinol oxidase subunit 3
MERHNIMELTASLSSDLTTETQQQNRIGRFGMWLFLAALTVLFLACVVGYLIIRLRVSHNVALGTLHLPPILWISTLAIVLGSLTMERACRLLSRNQIQSFKQHLIWTDMLTAAFVATQLPGLWMLLKMHERLVDGGVAMYGMVFMVILLHALHVVGGIVPLIVINKRAFTTGYTAQTILPVRVLTMYWHFLDVVWIILFALLSLLG